MGSRLIIHAVAVALLGGCGGSDPGEEVKNKDDEDLGATEAIVLEVDVEGKRIQIAEEEIPLLEFLRVLSEYHELPIVVDSDVFKDKVITIALPIADADHEIVQAILEVNGILISERSLSNGKKVLTVEESSPPRWTGRRATAVAGRVWETRVFTLESPGAELAKDIGLDEVIAVVVPVRELPPSQAIRTLNDAIPEGNAPLEIVEVAGTSRVILTGKASEVKFALRVLKAIDRPESTVAR